MGYTNIEIKARLSDPSFMRNYLQKAGARFMGIDRQIDTYFRVEKGRLKLREGNIENNLIYYNRPDQAGPKASHFELLNVAEPGKLKTILTESAGILKVVRKSREIYYIDNVKFHIDSVDGLGSFAEIEAGNVLVDKNIEELNAQCQYYLKELGIKHEDLLEKSYSDMIPENETIVTSG